MLKAYSIAPGNGNSSIGSNAWVDLLMERAAHEVSRPASTSVFGFLPLRICSRRYAAVNWFAGELRMGFTP
jgi:hypothetical protein